MNISSHLAAMRRRRTLRRGGDAVTQIEALGAWGAHDRDNPFPTYSEVRKRAPVHNAPLVDGHHAWLVGGYAEAGIALNEPRLSKDMLAAMARGGAVRGGRPPGRAFRA